MLGLTIYGKFLTSMDICAISGAMTPLIEKVRVELCDCVVEGCFDTRVFELATLILAFPYVLSEEFPC